MLRFMFRNKRHPRNPTPAPLTSLVLMPLLPNILTTFCIFDILGRARPPKTAPFLGTPLVNSRGVVRYLIENPKRNGEDDDGLPTLCGQRSVLLFLLKAR